jgi:hypothetical protein
VRDDKTGSRGQDGSPSDPDGLGIPSRSAPASSRDAALIGAIERELKLIKFWNAPWMTHDAIRRIFKAGQKWLDDQQESQFLPSSGRPSFEDYDEQVLLDLRAANPGSDCWKEFGREIGPRLGVPQQRRRYNRACRNIVRKAGVKDCVPE